MVSMLHKLIGDGNEKALKKLYPLRDKINAREAEVRKLTDLQLREKTEEFKGRLGSKGTLDDLLPEAFAVVREMAMRRLGQRHYDVQLIGGVVLHQGEIAEMKTGEGKTLVATLPVYLNALSGGGVHVVNVDHHVFASGYDVVAFDQVSVDLDVKVRLHVFGKRYADSRVSVVEILTQHHPGAGQNADFIVGYDLLSDRPPNETRRTVSAQRGFRTVHLKELSRYVSDAFDLRFNSKDNTVSPNAKPAPAERTRKMREPFL